jgi:magnesium-transporting ATPase (P-type)
LGAAGIATRGALVNAIESLSHVDVLCMDKTGTLTINRLIYHELHPLGSRSRDEVEHLLGVVSLSDELRHEARETIVELLRLGIQIKIISGDDPQTVAALAKQAGFSPDIEIVSGPELDQMPAAEFHQAATNATISGHISLRQKESWWMR